jgi:hypothetical protein
VIALQHSKGYLVANAWRDVLMLVDRVVDRCMGCLKLLFVQLDIRAAKLNKRHWGTQSSVQFDPTIANCVI